MVVFVTVAAPRTAVAGGGCVCVVPGCGFVVVQLVVVTVEGGGRYTTPTNTCMPTIRLHTDVIDDIGGSSATTEYISLEMRLRF